jgi:glycerol kinase
MKNYKLLKFAIAIGMGSCLAAQAQEQTNEVLMNWHATGYTVNPDGHVIVTNLNQQTLINKVAEDNGIDPKDCEFVYRVEKRDTAVVWKTNGVFIADVYQMEYTFQDVTNESGTLNYCESLLNDEYHTNAIGSTFGVETKRYNSDGYLMGYNYHGTFHCAFPENNVVFTGTFATGARVYLKQNDD